MWMINFIFLLLVKWIEQVCKSAQVSSGLHPSSINIQKKLSKAKQQVQHLFKIISK